MNRKGPPTFLVSADCQRITYKGMMLDFPAFGTAVRSLLAATAEKLDDLLSKIATRGHPNLVDARDMWPETLNGYSWATQVPFFSDSMPSDIYTLPRLPSPLVRALMDSTNLLFEGKPNGQVVRQYLSRFTDICQNLALLVFLTAGKPPLVSDTANFLYANSKTEPRNMFVRHEHFWFLYRQSRNAGIVGLSETLTAYKISKTLTDLLWAYFVFVRPAEVCLYSLVHTEASEEESKRVLHLCSTRAWINSSAMLQLSPTGLSKLVVDFFSQKSLHEQPIGPLAYRQFYSELVLNYWEQQLVKIDVNAEQAGHTIRMAQTNYGVEIDQLSGMPTDKLLQSARESEIWWGELLQIDKGEVQPPDALHIKHWKAAEKKMDDIRKLEEVCAILQTRPFPNGN